MWGKIVIKWWIWNERVGTVKRILGIELNRDKTWNTLSISQSNYFDRVVKQFYMENSRVVKTPLAQHFNLSSSQYLMLMLWEALIMNGMVSCPPDLGYK